MHRFARPTMIGALGATILGLALIPLANSRTASPRGASDTAAELAACVRELRTKTPALSYQAGVVRCVRPTRVETRSDVRWSTCKGGGAPAPGERCETGSARIELRATDADWDWSGGAKGWPRWAERWHLYGRGTARCTRTIHGLPAGDPQARRTAVGRIEHVDYLILWPSGSTPGTIALGVYPRFQAWSRTTPPDDALALDAPACRPLLALDVRVPPHESVAAPTLLDRAGVTVRARARVVWRVPRDLPAFWRPVGGPLVTRIDGRTTATFEVSARRMPGA